MGTDFLKMLLLQAEDVCHCVREAGGIFGYRHCGKRVFSQNRFQECQHAVNVNYFQMFTRVVEEGIESFVV